MIGMPDPGDRLRTGPPRDPSRVRLYLQFRPSHMHEELPSSPHAVVIPAVPPTLPNRDLSSARLAADPTQYRELWHFMLGMFKPLN